MKHIQMSLLACGLALTITSGAMAAPASQFGYSGWSYANESVCEGTCEQQCSQCRNDDDCCTCPVCCVTGKPNATPTTSTKPVISQTGAPTVKPTAAPTAKPTATPKPTQSIAPTKAPSPTSTVDYTTNSIQAQEQTAFNLLSKDRLNNGVSALTLDAELCNLARLKSIDMKENNYFAHQSPTYGSAADLLRAKGYAFTAVGENIAHHATVDKAQAAFMSSTSHRQNILGSQWTKVGIGICLDDNGYVYVTQLFVR